MEIMRENGGNPPNEGEAVAQLRDELKLANEQTEALQLQIQEHNKKKAKARKSSRKNEQKSGVLKIIEPYIKNVLMRNVVFVKGQEETEKATYENALGRYQGQAAGREQATTNELVKKN